MKQPSISRLFTKKPSATGQPETVAEIVQKIERVHGEYAELAAQLDDVNTAAALDWGDTAKDDAYIAQQGAITTRLQTATKVIGLLEAQLTVAVQAEYERVHGELQTSLKAAQNKQEAAVAESNKKLAEYQTAQQAEAHADWELQNLAGTLHALEVSGTQSVREAVAGASKLITAVKTGKAAVIEEAVIVKPTVAAESAVSARAAVQRKPRPVDVDGGPAVLEL